jgi:hypothetical protein
MIFTLFFTISSLVTAAPHSPNSEATSVKRHLQPSSISINAQDRNHDGLFDKVSVRQNGYGRYSRFTATDSNFDGTFDRFRFRTGQNSYSGYPYNSPYGTYPTYNNGYNNGYSNGYSNSNNNFRGYQNNLYRGNGNGIFY